MSGRKTYWGPATQRALDAQSISDQRLPPGMVRALGIVKRAVLAAHRALHPLPARQLGALLRAAEDVILGGLNAQFPLDPSQRDAAHDACANEVVARRAAELLGSSDDAFDPPAHVGLGLDPSAGLRAAWQVALLEAVVQDVLPPVKELVDELAAQAMSRPEMREALQAQAAALAHAGAALRNASQDLRAVTLGLPEPLDAAAIAHLNDVTRLDHAPGPGGPEAVRAALEAVKGMANALAGLRAVAGKDVTDGLTVATDGVTSLLGEDGPTVVTASRWLPALAAMGRGIERAGERG